MRQYPQVEEEGKGSWSRCQEGRPYSLNWGLIVAWALCVVIDLSDRSGMYDMSTLFAVLSVPSACMIWYIMRYCSR